jgi:ABC-type multidrug transport system fused ATPase/permease subunit
VETYRKLFDLLSYQERKRGVLLLAVIVVMALLEVVGVASVIPFMSVLANPQVVETNEHLNRIYSGLGFESHQRFLFFLGLVVLGFITLSIAFKALTTYALTRFTEMRNYSLSKRLVAGYLCQPYEWFLNRHSGDLGKSILSEVTQVINGALIPLMQAIAHGAVSIALLALLLIVDAKVALIAAAVLGGAYGLIYLGLRRYLSRIGADRVKANRERFTAVQEAFGGIKDVKVAALEGAMLNRYDGPAKRFASHQAASQVASQLPRFAMEIISFAGILAVALYLMAGAGGLQQALPVLSVFAFAGYRLMPALQSVYANVSKLRFASPALEALHRDFTSLEGGGGDLLNHQHPVPMGVTEAIRLEQVDYSYPKAERPALNGLNLTIPAHTTVGLVGATGSGKTTTVDIILGLLRPQRGRLSVDGESITPANVRAWQRTIGYVPQHIYLADDSVAANIAFGLPPEQVDMQAVERAARIANLHVFVSEELPNGYATTVGERGVRLSGGQRQRIGIARALYFDPPVLILDEATSALDGITEQAVMEAVNNLGHKKTIILIAHRLATVHNCDCIYLLEHGRVTAQGRYEELVANNERFREMAQVIDA